MKYKFEKVKENYSVFSSASVLQSFPGLPAFPVRLASEVFLRVVEILDSKGGIGKYSVYDPFCGSGYLITTLALLHSNKISKILCSDINCDAANLARLNLDLLSKEGLNRRVEHLQDNYKKYNKPSHLEAIENADYISRHYHSKVLESIPTKVFCADAFHVGKNEFSTEDKVDIVISDLPYGNQTILETGDERSDSRQNIFIDLFQSLSLTLKHGGVIVLISIEAISLKQALGINIITHVKIGHRHIYFCQSTR